MNETSPNRDALRMYTCPHCGGSAEGATPCTAREYDDPIRDRLPLYRCLHCRGRFHLPEQENVKDNSDRPIKPARFQPPRKRPQWPDLVKKQVDWT